MSEEILDSITLLIFTTIIGIVFVILGIALNLSVMIWLGGFFVAGIPIFKIINAIFNK